MRINILFKYIIFIVLSVFLSPLVVHALPGDLNSSGRVDGYDLILFGLANGSSNGNPKWNPDADLDGSGVVDTADLEILSSNFGKNGISFGLWVGDEFGTEQVSKVSSTGNLLKRLGNFNKPISLSSNVSDGTVWVADSGNNQVIKLACFDGTRLLTINGMNPSSVSVNSQDGTVWVADYNNNRVIKLLPEITDGYTIGTETGAHIVINGFYLPRSVSVNPNTGVVWVADTNNNRVARLSPDITDGYDIGTDTGKHTTKTGFSSPCCISVNIADGTVWVADYNNDQVVKLSATATTEIARVGGFSEPFAIATNYMDGSVWIADRGNEQVVRLASDGLPIFRVGGFDDPYSLGVNPLDGSCWIADYNNNQVVRLSANGSELIRIGGFYNPIALSVTHDEVSASKYPTVTSVVSSNNVDVSEAATFTGIGLDPDGDIVLHEWDFDGDGAFDYSSTTTGVTTHAYTSEGVYNPVFRVTDNHWLTATDYSQIVRVGTLRAIAGSDVSFGKAPLTVNFTGNFFDPLDGLVDTYQWDFDGDNIFDSFSATTANTSHTYTESGDYTATFKVTDGPHTASDSISIDVSASSPGVTASGSPSLGAVPLIIDFKGSGTDPDGNVVLYEWDFEGDGEYDWFSVSGGDTSHTYMAAGSYISTLRVTDNDGLIAAAHVSIEAGMVPPTAVANADTREGHEPLTVNFNADGSADPDGDIVLYEWDFDSDGTWEYSSADTGDTAHIYITPGTYTVSLRVTDNDDYTAINTVEIIVVPPTLPFVTAGVDTITGISPLTVTFTGTGKDLDGNISAYHWNFGEDYVWVADRSNDQVVRLYQDGSGEIVRKSGFNDPYSVSINPSDGTVWVADYHNHDVVRLTADGETELARVTGFYNPVSVSVNPTDGTVWVADTKNDRVVRLSSGVTDGYNIETDSGSHVVVPGFDDPYSVSANPTDGTVWVADYFNNQVVQVSSDGTSELVRVSGFYNPVSVSVNPTDGTVWVADTKNDRVVRLSSGVTDGYNVETDSGSHVVVPGFNDPFSVSANPTDGTVWVADYYNHQVVQVSSDGTSELVRVSGFYYPRSVSVNPTDGTVWVADYYNHQIVKLSSTGTELVRLSGFVYPCAVAVVDSGAGNYFESGTTGHTSHVYSVPGVYHAVFTVTDNNGNTATKALDITVYGIPEVSASSDIGGGPAPLTVFFSATATDLDGTISKYEWDFDGDGTYDPDSVSSANARHVYAFAGTFNATLRVTDDDGYSDTDFVTITVDPTPPTATAGAAPVSGNAPLEVNFSGSGTDPDGVITLYGWDFYSDGTWQFSSPETVECLHTYDTPGTYTATLKVTDDIGLSDTDSMVITVNDPGTPSASLYATSTQGVNPLEVCFYAHGIDSDGTIATYEIDFDGDGVYETLPGSPTVFGDKMENGEAYWTADSPWTLVNTHYYSKSYSWTDSPGGDYANNADTSLTSTTIDLSGTTSPKLIFRHRYHFKYGDYGRVEVSGNDGTSWTQLGYYSNSTLNTWTKQEYDLSSYAANDQVKIRFRLISNDSDTGDGWHIDDVWVGDCITHTYSTYGDYTADLRVTDNDSKQATTSEDISVFANENSTFIWVADYYHNQVVKLLDNGTRLATISGFNRPRAVEVDPTSGDVWVADTNNDRVVRLSSGVSGGYDVGNDSGSHIVATGFNDPYGFSVDASDSSVWVADYSNNQVVKLASDGTELYRVDGFYHPRRISVYQADGSVWITDTSNDQVVKLDSDGNELQRISGFNDPVGISVDQADGAVCVADYYNNQVVKLASDGTELARVSGFYRPLSVSVNQSDKTVWVAEWEGDQAIKLTTDLSEIIRLDDFNNPHNLRVNPGDGTVWLADTYNDQIVKLAPDGTELLRISGFNDPLSVSVDPAVRHLVQPPVANASANPTSGDASLAVTFSGSTTDDGSVVRYQWDFDGDGTYDYDSSTTGNTTHTYPLPGTYNPIFRVTDNDGMMGYDTSITIYVGPLTVYAGALPSTGNAPLNVALNGYVKGLAAGNTITEYAWDFDGDGVFDFNSSDSSKTNYTYPLGGTYHAVLRVTDKLGNQVFGSTTITVNKTGPSAYNVASPTSGGVSLTINLDGSGSDPDGSIVRYEWDYDGDGVYDWFSDSTANTYFKYETVGAYEAILRVTDNDGLTATASKQITVTERADPPTAVASAGIIEGIVPLPVNFTGTGNDPDDGTITLYEWDFDGDGTYDCSSATTGATDYTYNSPGLYNATFRVTDADNLTATDHVLITVKGSGVPTAVANAAPTSGATPLTVSFDATGSSDPDGNIVLYEWTFADEVVWVADYYNNKVKRLSGFRVDKTLSDFNRPYRLAIDQTDWTVWVSDRDNDEVVKIKADGSKELFRVSGFDGPYGLSVNQTDSTLWVADHYHHQVVKLDANGSELLRVDGFDNPTSVAVDPTDSSVWVADYDHNQVVKLDANGVELARIGGFNRPYWVSVNHRDHSVWVADRYNHQVVKLAGDTPDGYNLNELQDPPYHKIVTGFNEPLCTTVDPNDGTVWVCDYVNNQMVKISADAEREIARVGGFNRPHEVFVNPADSTVWVADYNNHQIVKLSSAGREIGRLSGFYHPTSVVIHNPPSNTFSSPTDGPTSYTYNRTGKRIAVLTVTDNDGNSDTDSVTIRAGEFPESLPIAYPTSGPAPLEVRISANGCSPTGTLEGFFWDFDGNDTIDWSTTISENHVYTYQSPGTYIATQRVVDNWGLSDSKSVTITVTMPEGAPTAEAIADPVEGPQPLEVSFTGLGTDSDGFIKTYEWDFDGDGVFDYGPSTTGMTFHTYNDVSIYNAVLRVTDDEGNRGADTVRVEVKQAGAPTAVADASQTSGESAMTVNFTGSGTDDGTIELYEWDFDGDGVYDYSSTTTGDAAYAYTTPGSFDAILRVTDNEGMTDTHVVNISVSAGITATLSTDVFDPSIGETISINLILTTQAAVTVKVKDRTGNVVRTLANNVLRSGGYYSDMWDGKDDGGDIVSAGVYLYIIEYTIGGQTYIYDITNNVDADRYAPSVEYPPSFDPLSSETNFFRYTLDTKSEVTVYMSYFGGEYGMCGPRVKTLLLRKPQKEGSYVLVWDGTDDSGNLVEPHTYVIAVFGWRLPENAIIVSTKPIISDLLVSPTHLNPDSGPYSELSQATLTYTLSKRANVTTGIYNSENYLVKTITVNNVPAGGGNTIKWNGKNENEVFVAPGTYRLKLIAIDENGNQSSEANALLVIFY